MKCCCGKKCTIYYFCIIKIKFLWFLFLGFLWGRVLGYRKTGIEYDLLTLLQVPGKKVLLGESSSWECSLCPHKDRSRKPRRLLLLWAMCQWVAS